MKILTVNELAFKLPDDFSGSVSEGLRLLATYLESDSPHLPGQPGQDYKVRKISTKGWDEFQDVVYRGGKVSGAATVQTLVDGKWVISDDAGVDKCVPIL